MQKLSDEDTINLHRQNIFYPETKLYYLTDPKNCLMSH